MKITFPTKIFEPLWCSSLVLVSPGSDDESHRSQNYVAPFILHDLEGVAGHQTDPERPKSEDGHVASASSVLRTKL